MKFVNVLLALILTLHSFCVFAAKPIQDLSGVKVPVYVDGSQPTIEEVKQAVIAGCHKRGWTPVISGANQITASILVRSKHFAEVEISYSEADYSITYKSSKNLDYNEKRQRIHRNYNSWISKLSSSIQREFGVRAPAN